MFNLIGLQAGLGQKDWEPRYINRVLWALTVFLMALQVHREGLPLKLLINDQRLIVNYVEVVHRIHWARQSGNYSGFN